jgi:hypothetical protein
MMTITLRSMTAAEFPAYRDYFIIDYAAEIAANFGYPLAQSRAIAAKELRAWFICRKNTFTN